MTWEHPHTPSRNTHRRTTMHICPVHHPTQIQTLSRQYYQQTFRSRHDSTHIVPKKGLEVKPEDAKKLLLV